MSKKLELRKLATELTQEDVEKMPTSELLDYFQSACIGAYISKHWSGKPTVAHTFRANKRDMIKSELLKRY